MSPPLSATISHSLSSSIVHISGLGPPQLLGRPLTVLDSLGLLGILRTLALPREDVRVRADVDGVGDAGEVERVEVDTELGEVGGVR